MGKFRSGSKPKGVPEKKMIYEILSLLGTSMYASGQMFTTNYMISVCNKLKTMLKDGKTESRVNEYENNSAFHLLSSVGMYFSEDIILLLTQKNDTEMEARLKTDKTAQKLANQDMISKEVEKEVNNDGTCDMCLNLLMTT